MVNPITSPTWMAIINTVLGVAGVAESTGLTHVLGNTSWGGPIIIGITVLNAVAHAFSPPTAGPLSPSSVK